MGIQSSFPFLRLIILFQFMGSPLHLARGKRSLSSEDILSGYDVRFKEKD